MTQPTRQEILDAHDALGELRALAESNPPRHDTHAEKLEGHIFAALPPKPHPTMAEVEWDDEKHYLAEAENPRYGRVIMVTPVDCDLIEVLVPNLYPTKTGCSKPEDLTPTGKRYTLTEVQDD